MVEFLFILSICILLVFTSLFFLVFMKVLNSEKLSKKNARALRYRPDTYVLIFGARASVDGPSQELKARLNTAIYLEKTIQPELYFLYGGIDTVDEPEVMRLFLLNAGINAKKIVTDNHGNNTRNSIERFVGVVHSLPVQRLIAVSSGYHAARIQLEARKKRLDIYPISPEISPEGANSRVHFIRIISEVFAIIWYAMPRVLTSKLDTSSKSFRHTIPSYFIKKVVK